MSKETREWLSQNVLVGFTEKRGNAWHYREGDSNHYEGAIPLTDVETRLFNWFPVIVPMAGDFGEEFVPFAGKVGVFRSDNRHGLGIFGEDYPATSYHDRLIKPLGQILSVPTSELAIGSAGLLEGGATGWVQVEAPDNILTPEGVQFRSSLLAVSSFNGKVANTYKPVVTMVVCDNTLAAAMGEKSQTYKVKNSKNSAVRIADARQALGIIFDTADEFTERVKELCEITVTDKQWSDFLTAHVMTDAKGNLIDKGRGLTMAERKRDELCALYNGDERCEPWQGTAFGVMQTVNTWNQHMRNVNKSAGQEVARAERNFQNLIMGKTEQDDSETWETLSKVLALA